MWFCLGQALSGGKTKWSEFRTALELATKMARLPAMSHSSPGDRCQVPCAGDHCRAADSPFPSSVCTETSQISSQIKDLHGFQSPLRHWLFRKKKSVPSHPWSHCEMLYQNVIMLFPCSILHCPMQQAVGKQMYQPQMPITF